MTSISPSYDDYLMHHGVKGMKWGVRKKPDGKSRTTRTFEKLASSGEKKSESETITRRL